MGKKYLRILATLVLAVTLCILSGCSSSTGGQGSTTAQKASGKQLPKVHMNDTVPDINMFKKTGSVKLPKRVQGKWSDNSSTVAYTITEDKINNMPVVAVFRPPAQSPNLYVRVQDGQQTKDLYLQCMYSEEKENMHQYLVVNNKSFLRHPGHFDDYYESVDGVYLGMTPDQIIEKWGKPSSVTEVPTKEQFDKWQAAAKERGVDVSKRKYAPYMHVWKYDKKGCVLRIEASPEILEDIWLSPGGSARFDKSGLGYDSPMSEFAKKYNSERLGKKYNDMIAPDEFIEFYQYPKFLIFSDRNEG
jgi:hypothetical protein